MPYATQWLTPDGARPSGSNISRTRLLVPSGTLLQCSSGDTFSPTQFGFLFTALVLATFFGIILPSWKVFDSSVNRPAAFAAEPTRPTASAMAAVCKKMTLGNHDYSSHVFGSPPAV